MLYHSTRCAAETVDSAQAVLNGLAPDGGLYVPAQLPAFDAAACLQENTMAMATRIIGALQQFDLIFMVMDKSNPALPKTQTVVYYFYDYAFSKNLRGIGATIVVCMLIIILLITFILQKSEKKWVFYN